jgi:hypothetical protein
MRTALALSLTLSAGAARADSEQAFSVGAGYATFSAPGEKMGEMTPPQVSPTGGGALVVSYERAIGSDVALRGEVAFGMFFGGNAESQSSRSYAVLGDAGAVFRFDIFKYVPYAFAGLGAVSAGGGPIDRGTDLVLVVGGGLDRLWSRQRSAGLELRIASFGGDVTVFTVGLRGTTRWGFF